MTRRVAAVVEQCWHRVPGGTATSAVRTLDAIAAVGEWQVVGIAAHHAKPAPDGFRPGIDVRHLPLPRRALYETWHRLRWPGLGRWAGPVDVVHATGGVVPPTRGVPLVVTIHDLAFLHRPEHFSRRGVDFMTRSLDLARSEASRVIVPSAATRADCLDHGIGLDRLRVVHWGVDPVEISDGDRVVVKERYELPSEFLLWVGTAEPRKNLPRLVQAHRLSGVDLPLILAGPKGWGPDLESIIGGYEGVRHIGPLAGADLAVLYDLASVFIYPSLLEGFGMPVLEAMGQGTPVITSRGTATEEVAGEGGVLVDPLDVGEIAAAIVSLSSDTERRGMLSSAAISRAAELDWQRTAELTTAVYEEAVG